MGFLSLLLAFVLGTAVVSVSGARTSYPIAVSYPDLSVIGLTSVAAFFHAVEEVNQDPEFEDYVQFVVSAQIKSGWTDVLSCTQVQGQQALESYLGHIENGVEFLAVVGDVCNLVTQSEAQLGAYYKIPALATGSTSPDLSDKTSYPFTGRVFSSNVAVADVWVRFCQENGWTNMVTLSDLTEGNALVINRFRSLATEAGIKVPVSGQFDVGGDLSVHIEAVKASSVSVIGLAMSPTDARRVFLALSEAGLTGEGYVFLGTSEWGADKFWIGHDSNATVDATGANNHIFGDDGRDQEALDAAQGTIIFMQARGTHRPQFQAYQASYTAFHNTGNGANYPEIAGLLWFDGITMLNPLMYITYDSVYFLAHIIKNLMIDGVEVTSENIHARMTTDTFEGVTGAISLDDNLDGQMAFEILNIKGSYIVSVGSFYETTGLVYNDASESTCMLPARDPRPIYDCSLRWPGYTFPGYWIDYDGMVMAEQDNTTSFLSFNIENMQVPSDIHCAEGLEAVEGGCEMCGVGTFWSRETKKCTKCDPGSYQSSLGQIECLPCPVGTEAPFEGSSQCSSCPVRAYSSTEGQSTCTECPSDSRTCGLLLFESEMEEGCSVGATNVSQCICVSGFAGGYGSECGACPNGASCCQCRDIGACYGDEKRICDEARAAGLNPDNCDCDWDKFMANIREYGQPCPTCFSGSSYPVTKFGFWESDVENTFLECSPADSCLGGPNSECAFGYTGRRCGDCIRRNATAGIEKDFFKLNGRCVECPTGSQGLMVVMLLLPFAFALYALRKATQHFRSGALAIAIDFFQTFLLFRSFELNWPSSIHWMQSYTSFLNLNIEVLAPECSFALTYWDKQIIIFFVPIIMLVVFAALYFIIGKLEKRKLLKAVTPATNGNLSGSFRIAENHARDVIINSYLMCLTVAHAFLSSKSLEVFRCQWFPDNRYYLAAEPGIQCYEGEWLDYFIIGILGILAYGVGIPVLFFLILWPRRKSLEQKSVKRRFGSLFLVYKPTRWWFEIWNKSKKIWVLASVAIFSSSVLFQALSGVTGLVAALLLGRLAPYRYPRNNVLMSVSSLALVFLLFTGVLFFNDELTDTARSALTACYLTVFIIVSVLILHGIFYEFIAFYGGRLASNSKRAHKIFTSLVMNFLFNSRAVVEAKYRHKPHWALAATMHDELDERKTMGMKRKSRVFRVLKRVTEAATLFSKAGRRESVQLMDGDISNQEKPHQVKRLDSDVYGNVMALQNSEVPIQSIASEDNLLEAFFPDALGRDMIKQWADEDPKKKTEFCSLLRDVLAHSHDIDIHRSLHRSDSGASLVSQSELNSARSTGTRMSLSMKGAASPRVAALLGATRSTVSDGLNSGSPELKPEDTDVDTLNDDLQL